MFATSLLKNISHSGSLAQKSFIVVLAVIALTEMSNVYQLRILDDKGDIISVAASSIPSICDPLVKPVVPAHILDAFGHLKSAGDFDLRFLLALDFLMVWTTAGIS